MSPATYRGRFAPSPTGPLHFGSLVAAVASWCDARAAGGSWLVRMEDLDRPREIPGAAQDILRTLEALGLQWDGPVLYQSRRGSHYASALARLEQAGQVYRCACTRREIADSAVLGIDGPVYPGTCRGGIGPGRLARARRVRTDCSPVEFVDDLQGVLVQVLERDVGDFILLRADGLHAYQLAVVVDDFEQGITHVVRGADLLASTPRQIHLQRLLGYATPRYLHVPVAVDERGEKLSKQTRARAVAQRPATEAVSAALAFLGHSPPDPLRGAEPGVLLAWAASQWDRARLPAVRTQPAPATLR